MGKYAIGLGAHFATLLDNHSVGPHRPLYNPSTTTRSVRIDHSTLRQQPLGRSASTTLHSVNNHSVGPHRPLYTPSTTTRSIRIDHSTLRQQPLGRPITTLRATYCHPTIDLLPPYGRPTATLQLTYCHPTGSLLRS
nr:hypothetical protein Iba_chr10bCG9610 [Ipomoea batatas]